MKIKSSEFQDEFTKSVELGRYTERMGRFILALVDNIAYSGIVKHNGTTDTLEELKGFALMDVLNGLWNYHKKDRNSRAIYYAIAIIKNSFRRMGKERLGANATKTLQGTDSYGLYINGDNVRLRKMKAEYVDVDRVKNIIYDD